MTNSTERAPTCPDCGFLLSAIHGDEWWCERCPWSGASIASGDKCPCGGSLPCPHTDTGYPWCSRCKEHHRHPETCGRDDLVGFLLERIAKDEVFARGALTISVSATNVDHRVLWAGRRMLADATAKRAILERRVEDETLRVLATAYADHPDYREEWRP